MNYMPKRRKRPKMKVRESSLVRCPGHLKWVRGHECCFVGKINGHFGLHSDGQDTTEAIYGVSLEKIAAEMWERSPHGQRYRAENSGISRSPHPHQ